MQALKSTNSFLGEWQDGKPAGANRMVISFTVENKVGILSECLKIFSDHNVDLEAIESRPSREIKQAYDFYVEFDSSHGVSKEQVSALVEALKQKSKTVTLKGDATEAKCPWFPRKIQDLDLFSAKVLSYGEELEADHPGFTDEEYRKRRMDITLNAKVYRHGQPIPRVNYTPEEIQTWNVVYTNLSQLFPTNACKQFLHILPLLEQNCGYGPNNIPQLEDVSNFLQQCTGWRLRPVTGLLSPRDFLNGLAFRVFHSTQYIRHHSKPMYTPEPDVCHELIGHVPLLADQAFAEFSQTIGLASLGATDEDIEKLATCYWFTVEFGICKEEGKLKAYGAGLLSSFGELNYCLTDEPKTAPFDPQVTAITPYPITKYQPLYFVADSFESAKQKMISFSQTLDRPFEVSFDSVTQSVIVLDSKDKILKLTSRIQNQLVILQNALNKLEF